MKTKFSGILTLLLAFVVQFTFAQEKTISGTVSDENGLPLPTATVIIQGTTTGTSTDFDGNYTINAKSGDVLIYSYVGYANQSATVGTSNKMDVTLQPDNTLDEVVVTAFGIKREKKSTVYQTEKVTSEELLKVQPQSAASALAGKVAGLQINVQNNGVNPSTKILLRGTRSITSNNSALIVIDGSISTQGAFDQLNPSDIENINTLKGATAAALYGSNASNGVLIITTKQGEKGEKFRVGVNSTYTVENVSFMPDFQTEYGSGWQGDYESIENTNWGPRFDGISRRIGPIFADGSFQTTPYTAAGENLKDFYNTGSNAQNTVYLSGSDEMNSYYVSLGKTTADGVVPSDEYKRNTFRLNASRKMGSVKLGVNSSFITDNTNVVGSSIGSQDRPIYWFLLNTPTNIPLSNYSDWRNNKYASPNGFANGYYENPYWAIDNNRNIDESSRFIGNIYGDWEATDWLTLTARFGVNTLSTNGKNWRNEAVYDSSQLLIDTSRPSPSTSFSEDSESKSIQYTTDFLAQGNFDLMDKLSLTAILGANNFTSNFRQSAYRANNLSIPGFYDLSNTTGQLEGGLAGGAFVNESNRRTYGLFGDFTFGYDNFLYLNVAGRNDWTSTLSPDNNSYFYPSIGLSFVFSELIDFDALNYGKFTISNSTVYNAIDPYAINETYAAQIGFPYATTGLNGFVVSGTAVDKDVKKEKLNSTEFGLNLEFLKRRVTLNASYYISKTTDLITYATTAPSAGSVNYLTNIGGIDGKGLELTLGLIPFKAENVGDFNWNLNVNYSANESVVESIGEGIESVQVGGSATAGVYAVVGEQFPQIKATSYIRDDQGRVVVGSNGNPLEGQLKNLGSTTPDYIVGLTNSFSYKGFTLGATMDYRTGHVYYSQLADSQEFTARSLESVSSNRQDFIFPNSVINTGTTANPVYVENTNIQTTGGLQNFWTSDYNNIKENYVLDATSFKIRELSLQYELPESLIQNTGLHRLSLGLVARNVLVYLPKENRFSDPEFNNNSAESGNDIGRGGYLQSPPTRSFGVNINFEF